MAGAAAKHIGIDKEQLLKSIRAMFSNKGEAVVEMNVKAFEMGFGITNIILQK
jgi:Pyruvate/2-oxoacid:ferredoxin oxidoreductase gamma subunit